ncbi:MAG: serine/threonine protein kinase [Acidobacteria bacterium]|nr:serine/threonine protein kinase [Acidobacteriota bacterium]
MNSDAQQNSEFPLSEHITRDYRILRLLGKGGMGEVYLAEQLRVGRRLIALKVLNHSLATSPEIAKRFENEASSAGRINHRNVVTVYESRITDDGQIYVAMEFVEGKSLNEVLKEQEQLPLDKVIAITRQICSGLAAAHQHGIVHRDIKPDNIMLTEEEGGAVIKLLDFGIARLSEADASAGRTRAGVIMGTPTYMSPEQALGKTSDKIDARSDIYSVALVVYQMLTGQVPFKAKTAAEIMQKHISEAPPSFQHWRTALAIPAAVEQVVMKALQKNRELRQQSIMDFANELAAAAKGISPVVPASQKDMPTIRIGKEEEATATAPLSSEKTSAGKAITHESPRFTANPKSVPTTAPPNPAAEPSAKVSPVTTTPPDLKPALETQSSKRIASRPPRRYRKDMLLAGLALLAIFVAVVVVIKITGGGKGVAIAPVIEYRIMTGSGLTLPMNNTLAKDEDYQFEVKLIERGSVYLFGEQTEKGEGLWQLVKAKSVNLQVGEWSQFPYGQSLSNEGHKEGATKYLLVFVPVNVNWSAAATLASQAFPTENNIAILPQEVATKIRESLKNEAMEMNAVGREQENKVSFALSKKDDAKRVAYYEITINQSP